MPLKGARRWPRRPRSAVPKISAAVRLALRRGGDETSVEFAHGIRHRLLARTPRAVAWEYRSGMLDQQEAIVSGKPLSKVYRSLISATQLANYNPTTTPYAFFCLHTTSLLTSRALYNIFAVIKDIDTKDSRAQVHSHDVVLKGSSLLVVRFSRLTMAEFLSLRGWSTSLLNGTARMHPLLLSPSPAFPVDGMRHTCVLGLHTRGAAKILRRLRDHGFVNYFPPEVRAHRTVVPPQIIGCAVLQRDFEQAVNFFLLNSATQRATYRVLYKTWKQGGSPWQAAQGLATGRHGAPLRAVYEWVWHSESADYRKAWAYVPVVRRAAFVRAVQEHVWNFMASARVAVYGVKVVKGDLVRRSADPNAEPRVVESDEEAAECSPYDVVIPYVTLPFSESDYTFPEHEVGYDSMCAVLGDFGLNPAQLSCEEDLWVEHARIFATETHHKYRPVFVKPLSLSWKFVRGDPTPLLPIAVRQDSDSPDGHEVSSPEGARKVVISAVLPLGSSMRSLVREGFITYSREFESMPRGWLAWPSGRPVCNDSFTMSDEEMDHVMAGGAAGWHTDDQSIPHPVSSM